MPDQQVIAQVTGGDLLVRLDVMSGNIATLTAKLDDIPNTLRDHEARLRLVERGQWKVAAVSAFISLVFGGLIGAIIAVASRHG
jgi:hypothetical protein